MNLKLISTVAILAGLSVTPASAQSPAPAKASKADVQKLVGSIKGNQAKFTAYCAFSKLQEQGNALAEKNPNDPKLKALGGQLDASANKVGPDFVKIIASDLDDASGALLDDLSKSCK
jgi:3-oxoacyl-ACP reductase-like protein